MVHFYGSCAIRLLVQTPMMTNQQWLALPAGSAGPPAMRIHPITQHPQHAPLHHVQGMESYCVRSYAEALEVVPYTLAENAGLNPIQIVTELRKLHASGNQYHGINVKKVGVMVCLREGVGTAQHRRQQPGWAGVQGGQSDNGAQVWQQCTPVALWAAALAAVGMHIGRPTGTRPRCNDGSVVLGWRTPCWCISHPQQAAQQACNSSCLRASGSTTWVQLVAGPA
jgi:hypothetical protein